MMKKNIRGNVVRDTLLDYNNLAETLKENTSNAVKSLLDEAVRETYAKLLSEEDENDYDVEEVDDTDVTKDKSEKDSSKKLNKEKKSAKKSKSEDDEAYGDEAMEGEAEPQEMPQEGGEEAPEEEMPQEGGEEAPEEEMPQGEEGSMDSEDDMGDLSQYQVGDEEGTYDLTQADDETVANVYKKLNDNDQVFVKVDKEANTVDFKDNETGAEYHIVLDDDSDYQTEPEGEGFEDEGNENEVDNFSNMTNESIIFEVALNEYDSHVGYTDNYQSKDVMTNPGTSEPGKNVNDWDAGVPRDGKKPWAKPKKNAAPFNSEKGKTVEEEDLSAGDGAETAPIADEANMEETVHRGAKKRMMGVKSHPTNTKGAVKNQGGAHHASVAGDYKETVPFDGVEESKMRAQVNKIVKENKELKKALGQFKTTLQEAAVTNLNLGQIIKLISENTTSKDEKKEIIARFGKEATTIAESKKLYESINRELKKKPSMSINEDKQFTATGSKMINETQIYQSEDLVKSLDLMHRLMNM